MEVFSKKLVIITDKGNPSTILDKAEKKGFQKEGCLIIGNFEVEEEDADVFQKNLYVLGILEFEQKVVGLVVVDKYMGDFMVIQTTRIVLDILDYSKIFEKPRQVNEICIEPLFVLSRVGVAEVDVAKDLFAFRKTVEGIYPDVDSVRNIAVTNILSTDEVLQLARAYLNTLRVFPDLEKLQVLQGEIPRILEKYSDENQEKGIMLLEVMEDGVERHALEEFSEKANIYELLRTIELRGGIMAAKLMIQS